MFGNFFSGKTVLVTGHTGFKGSWLSIWLTQLGAKVIGYALEPLYERSVYELSKLSEKIVDIKADIRDEKKLQEVFVKHKPDIVIHLAAQSLVRKSYDQPKETFETNIMGTINVIECAKKHNTKSVVLITSDKCYKNIEQEQGYKETDAFSDQDPYSASKGCTEMVVQSYRSSCGVNAATTRAGNVIGGGDWAEDRLIPDVVKALLNKQDIIIRNPNSTRPWQFVLEPLSGYLLLAKDLYEGKNRNEGWNFGPERASMISVQDLVQLLCDQWGAGKIVVKEDSTKKEAGLLYLDITKAKQQLGWKPRYSIQQTVEAIVNWYKQFEQQEVFTLCTNQIKEYENAP